MSKLQNTLVALQIRRYIDEEIEYFKHDRAPENDDVKKGLERAEIAISRAFRKFNANHTS